MERNLEVMKSSVKLGLSEKKSRSGLTGGDAAKLDHYIKKGKTLSDFTVLSAARNAIAVNEHNAKMGLVCATPTAGSAGCLPAVLTAAIQKLNLTHEQQLIFSLLLGLLVSSLLITLLSLELKEAAKPKLDLPLP